MERRLREMPHMMEVSARPWLEEMKVSSLGRIVMAELQQFGDWGFSWLWVMGVWQLGDHGRELDLERARGGGFADVLPHWRAADVVGSPYAVQAPYRLLKTADYDCSQLQALRNRLARVEVRGRDEGPCSCGAVAPPLQGMRLMLDFVPNHTAIDCAWMLEQPAFYIHTGARAAPEGVELAGRTFDSSMCLEAFVKHSVCFGGDGTYTWRDTAQLNYWNPDVRAAMVEELLSIAGRCDGVRCDMAHLVLNDVIARNWGAKQEAMGFVRPETEFWQEAIAIVREQHPGFVFLAETYSHHGLLQRLGFDYTYDKELYDHLSSFHLDNIRGFLSSKGQRYLQHSCHFTSNHDEARAVAHFGSWRKALCASWISFTLPGMRLHWKGEEEGKANRLAVHLRRAMFEDPQPEAAAAYAAMMAVVTEPIFRLGSWEYLPVVGDASSWMLLAWRWSLADEKRLVVVNFSEGHGAGRVVLSNAEPDQDQATLVVTELLSGENYLRNVAALRVTGLWVAVPAWAVQVFRYP